MNDSAKPAPSGLSGDISFIHEVDGAAYDITITRRCYDLRLGGTMGDDGHRTEEARRQLIEGIAEKKIRDGATSPVVIDLGDVPDDDATAAS